MISLIIPIKYDVYTIACFYIHIYEKLNISMGTILPPFHLSTLSTYQSTPHAGLTCFAEHYNVTIKNGLIRVRE